jgi:AdoMet-dependent rRNA methyltransferase SPB1
VLIFVPHQVVGKSLLLSFYPNFVASRLQVAAKYMPTASIKIGVDLDPIKPIKGCLTFQADITTARCTQLIKKEIKHFSADIVLNDGAPNVGTDWNIDSFA